MANQFLNRTVFEHCILEKSLQSSCPAGLSSITWRGRRRIRQRVTTTFSAAPNHPGSTIKGQHLCASSSIGVIGSHSTVFFRDGIALPIHLPAYLFGDISSNGKGELHQGAENLAWLVEHGSGYGDYNCDAWRCESRCPDFRVGCFLSTWSGVMWERDFTRDDAGSW
jgi:hypothetical protein